MDTAHFRFAAEYPKPSLRLRFAIAFFAVAISSTLIGGVLGLFEMQNDAEMMARAAVPAAATVVVEATSDPIRPMSINWPRRG